MVIQQLAKAYSRKPYTKHMWLFRACLIRPDELRLTVLPRPIWSARMPLSPFW